MKKILIAMMMIGATIGNANATDFKINEAFVVTAVLTQVLGAVNGDAKNDINIGGVSVGTVGIISGQGVKDCWTPVVYDSNGNATVGVQCN